MPFNVPEADRPKFNKRVKDDLVLLTDQIKNTALQAAAKPTIDFSTVINQIEQGEIPQEILEPPPIELNSIRDTDGNIISNPIDLFSTPLNKDKSKSLGLIDVDGNPTDDGELFFNMKEAGMFDDSGVITKKGKAYLVPPEYINEPENLEAFTQQWEDGVTRQETTWGEKGEALLNLGGEVFAGVGQGLWITAKNVYSEFDNRKGFGIPFMRSAETDNRSPELKAETVALNLTVAEKLGTNLAELGRMADVGSAWVIDRLKNDQFWIEGSASDLVDHTPLYAARQRQAKTRQTISNMEAGEVAEVVYGLEGAVGVAEEARATIGKDNFNQIYKNAGSATEILGGVENIVPGAFAIKAAKSAPLIGRVGLGAQRTIGKVLIKELEIGAAEAALESAKITVQKGELATRLTNKFIEGGATVGASSAAISRAEKATEIANKTAKITGEATAAIPELTSKLDELVKGRNSLATKIPEAAANATIKTLETGRKLRAMPANAIGATLEGLGDVLTKVDGSISNFLKDKGFDQMYNAALGAAGVAGLAGSPIIGAVATGAAALKAGKMISNYGKLFKYVGKEMVRVRGQIPFWKRVAAHTEPGSLNRGIAHSFNMLDLGGVTSDTLRRIPRGIAAAAPSDLMFEWLSDGADMRPETFYQALSESMYIGGSFAAAGGPFMGTKKRMRQNSIGDQLNLLQGMTDNKQKALFNMLTPETRSAVATYAIANPTLNYTFKDSGSSNYDPNTNTATINVKSNNSIKPLIAHETLHHTVIKNNMEAGISALFLGDTVNNTVGGLLRSRDGKLDPNFKAFKDAYYQRLNIAGMTDAEKNAIYPLDKVAVEYFIEQHSDQYAGMAESGELGAISASGDIKRKLSGVLETVLPRIPVLRDLHFKSGGMIDKDGAWVTGNGILDADGIKTNPITNKMFRDMNRRSSGLAPGQFEPLVSDKQDSGAQLVLDPSNPIDSELLHPIVKVDENGVPILENGKPVALDKVTLLQRALAGLTAKEVMQRKRAENYIPEKGEAHVDDIGEFQPGWLSNDVLAEMFAKNSFNPEQKRIIREMNRMIRKGDGGRAVMINFPATTRNKAGKAVYKAQGATLRDTVPVAITISKDGNLLFGLMSVNKLQENIQKRSQSRRGKKLYGGNVDLILRDTQAMMQFHKDGIDSIEYFKEKYGAVEATERKNFINTMFGLLNQKEQAVLNPMLIEDGVKSRDNVYRTYRADRVSKAVAMSPEDYPAMPFSYEATSQVKMPEQSRQMPEKPITSSSEEWKSMNNKEKDAYVFTPVEMTPSNRAEFNARVESGSLSADTPVVDINRSNLLTSKYGPPSSSATGNINTWIDDNTGKPVAVAFSENGNIPTKGERTPVKTQNRFMPEALDEDKFYSQLDRVITDKIPSRATPQQIMATIDPTRGSGVKAEEIKWSGIEQALQDLAVDGKVSKEALLKYLRDEGNIKFEEVSSGTAFNQEDENILANLEDRDASTVPAPTGFDSKYKKYQLPGGENYREVVLAIPQDKSLVEKNKTAEKLRKERKKLDNRLDEIQRLAKKLTQSGDTDPKAKMQMEELGKEYANLIEKRNSIPLESTQIQISQLDYTSSHFPNIPNYVAHMRLNERTDGNGNPGLFIEEIQSDRHQEGRKRGYGNERGVDIATREFNRIVKPSTDITSKEMQELVLSTNPRMIEWAKEKLGEDYDRIRELAMQDKPSVADAPFRTTWPIQMFKRTLRDAVDSGKDWVGWTTGETQADRFDLSREVDSVEIFKRDSGNWGVIATKNGNRMLSREATTSQLPEVIGKELAEKAVADGGGTYEGNDLKVGGSGMKGFYDNMLPKEISKYVKQWGGKVEKSDIPTKNKMGTGVYEPIWRVDITPEMKKGVAQGQARYMPEKVDADYMKAVEEGDVETQQRIVDEAAKAAGYTVGAYKAMPERDWRTDKPIHIIDSPNGPWAGFFTDSKGVAERFGRIMRQPVRRAILKIERPFEIDATGKAAGELQFDIINDSGLFKQKNNALALDAIKSGKYDAIVLKNTSDEGTITVPLQPEQIKSADPITRDDSGNIIPPSKRFDQTTDDIRYMPEPIPANYKSSRDDTYLKASLSPDGIMNADRPFKSTEALPTVSMRHDYPMQELVVSKFDKRESIVYAKNKNGEDVSFKFDPAMMNKPEFADFDDLYEGKVIQFAMADRHSAVDGDMGGHSFPDLKVNQDNIVADQNGKKYKIVWANNAWGPVANMSNKATKFGATSLLTYNMDQHAHDSNTRTVRIFSNEIANSGLPVADQSTILIVQNVALKKSQTSANKKDLRGLIANKNKLNKQLIIDDKILAGKKVKDATKLSIEDREVLIDSINDLDTSIKQEEEFLKESLGAKAATSDEMQVDKLFRDYQNKRRAYEKAPDSDKKKKSMEDSELNLRKHQKTKSFAVAEKLLPSRELDTFSNTFKGRKSLINAIKTKTAAAKWGMFDAQKISETIGDQMTGDSLHVVGSVELSSDPNFKAVYLGDDPKEIARMTPAEQAAAAQLKANPDFVGHEAYLWAMLGPAESKHYFNTNQRSVLDSVPDFVDEYSQLPVKADKKKLNDPESKASEFNIVNTVRDQSKIPVVFKAEPKQTDEK